MVLYISAIKGAPGEGGASMSPPRWMKDLDDEDTDMLQQFGSLALAELIDKVRLRDGFSPLCSLLSQSILTHNWVDRVQDGRLAAIFVCEK